MKIKNISISKIPFSLLPDASVFFAYSGYFMKIKQLAVKENQNLMIDSINTDNIKDNAVDLEDGDLVYFPEDEEVYPLEAELIIRPLLPKSDNNQSSEQINTAGKPSAADTNQSQFSCIKDLTDPNL